MTPVLLFVHGTNFCKEIWRPIERHLKKLPLLRCMSDVHFESIDLPYHGSKRDDSVVAVVDEMTATVHHPASKFVTLSAEAVHREVQLLRIKFGSRPIVGIGHSMGAVALWNVEARAPGTFGGLVFFEPFVEEPGTREPKIQRYIFNLALKRQCRWDTRQAAVMYFENVKGFSTWDRECLTEWLDGAIVPEENGSDVVVLACNPNIEAAIYCGERLWLSESEMARVACPVTLHSSDNTWLFDPIFFAAVEKNKLFKYNDEATLSFTNLLQLENYQ
ncbi:Hypothetical protein PHPALM_7462 [Phytophthora palmivora]|uniref:AB hydrolase-1 domain-containing protein n=1 Tax=Phytophthora palmivora TaxID=4796 RepID=A0A2P4YC92_9STRA|nr:Hypothetical protein PHPALM_7462 [Phytophthora palmivora]